MGKLAEWQFNETLRKNFLAFIADIYCVPQGWENMLKQSEPKHLEAMIERVLETDTLAKYISQKI